MDLLLALLGLALAAAVGLGRLLGGGVGVGAQDGVALGELAAAVALLGDVPAEESAGRRIEVLVLQEVVEDVRRTVRRPLAEAEGLELLLVRQGRRRSDRHALGELRIG